MMKDSKLDRTRFFPCVLQAVSGKDYVVYAYMNDGNRDETRCIDIDPFTIFEGPAVSEIPDSLQEC